MLEDIKKTLWASADKLRADRAAAADQAFADRVKAVAARRRAQITKGAVQDAHIRQKILASGFDF
jgi:hypothetical protein